MEWTMDRVAPNATVPAARSEAVAVTYGDHLFIFGGISNAGSSKPIEYNDLWSYDLVSCVWTEITPSGVNVPLPRCSHSAALLTDALGASYFLTAVDTLMACYG